jgi:hypothetical protein
VRGAAQFGVEASTSNVRLVKEDLEPTALTLVDPALEEPLNAPSPPTIHRRIGDEGVVTI